MIQLTHQPRTYSKFQKIKMLTNTLPCELVVLIFDFVIDHSVPKRQVSQVCKLETVSNEWNTNQQIQEYFTSFWKNLFENTIGTDERLIPHLKSLQKQGYKRVYGLTMAYFLKLRRMKLVVGEPLPNGLPAVLLGNGKSYFSGMD